MNVIKPGRTQNLRLNATQNSPQNEVMQVASETVFEAPLDGFQRSVQVSDELVTAKSQSSFRMPSVKTLAKGALALGAGLAFVALAPGAMVLGAAAGGTTFGAVSVVKEKLSDMFSIGSGYKATLAENIAGAAMPAAAGAALGLASVGVAIGSAPLVGALTVGGAAAYGVVKGGQMLADHVNPLNW